MTTTQHGSSASLAADLTEFTMLLMQTMRALKSAAPAMPAELRNGSLNRRHMPALLAVALSGPMSVSELATQLALGLSTASTMVGELSRAGLLQRSEDENDRRRTIVRLHENHRAAISAWSDGALAPLRRTLEQLEPLQRAHFMAGWRLLHAETEHNDVDVGCS